MLAEREKTASEQGSYFCNERYKVRVFRLPGALLHSGHMVTVTEKAASKIKELLAQEQEEGVSVLRVAVQGGGCSGFQYGLMIEEGGGDADQVFESNGVKLFVDPVSVSYLKGAEVDFVDTVTGGGFTIKNPNATSTCGCGSSFSV
jgi:iron-sulfur cluster assembly accessory protein